MGFTRSGPIKFISDPIEIISDPIEIISLGSENNLYIGKIKPKSDDPKDSIYIGDTRTIFLVKDEERIDLFERIIYAIRRVANSYRLYAWWTRL